MTSTDQAGALLSYRSVRYTMVKRKRLELPGNPKTPEHFELMIKQIHHLFSINGNLIRRFRSFNSGLI